MSHEHSEVTRKLDEAHATALVTMEGLALFCFNDARHYEGGFLRLPPHHVFSLTILGLGKPWPVGGKGDIHIEVVNPAQPGMYRYEKGDFNRQTGAHNDLNDFRWIADIEGEVHDDVLIKRRGPGLRRLFINSATIYTKKIREEEFVLIRADTTGEPCSFYGRQALVVGATLECADGGGIRVRTEGAGGEDIWLPKRPGDPYELIFNNGCTTAPHLTHSDFLLYYEVLSDRRGFKFDLRRAVDFGPLDTRCISQTVAPKHVDGLGLACDNGYLRNTSSLPK